jgi:hypothetical protein
MWGNFSPLEACAHPIVVLAVQNMDALGAVPKTQEIEFKALEGSLSMMSKGTVCTYYLMNFPPIFLSA